MLERMSSAIRREPQEEQPQPTPKRTKTPQPNITTSKTITVQCWNCDSSLVIHDLSRIYYGICAECGYAYIVLKK